MNRRPDPHLSPQAPAQEDRQAQIEDYLDYLCAPLLGIVPYAQRRRLRLETEDHLHALIEDFEAEGFAPPEAVAVALREYGEPWRIGQEFADAWLSGSAPPHLARYADAATLRAFGWFGVFSVINLLAVEQFAPCPVRKTCCCSSRAWPSFRPSSRASSPALRCTRKRRAACAARCSP